MHLSLSLMGSGLAQVLVFVALHSLLQVEGADQAVQAPDREASSKYRKHDFGEKKSDKRTFIVEVPGTQVPRYLRHPINLMILNPIFLMLIQMMKNLKS